MKNAHKITEYRIPKNRAEVREEKTEYVIRTDDPSLLESYEPVNELPDIVKCPECKTKTAEQDRDDQLFICTECGRETVLIGGFEK